MKAGEAVRGAAGRIEALKFGNCGSYLISHLREVHQVADGA
jgi:hypothetical protein